jgi:hypothetical protein
MDQGSLELGNAGEDRQHHAAGRRRGIGPRLGQRAQAGLGRVQALRNVEKIARRSGEAVQPGDRHHVAGAETVPSSLRELLGDSRFAPDAFSS